MAIAQKPGGANKPQPYDTADGKFTSTGSGGSSDTTAAPASNNNATPSMFSGLFKQKNAPAAADANGSAISGLFKPKNQNNNDNGEEDFNAFFESLNQKSNDSEWHKNHDLLTVDQVIENIDKYVSDNILDFFRAHPKKSGQGKYLWHDPDLGGVHFSYEVPIIFLNAIAKEQFVAAKEIDETEFKNYINEISSLNGGSTQGRYPQGNYVHLKRGSGHVDATLIAVGKKDSDLLLPNGMLGTCVYSSYNGYTHSTYGDVTTDIIVEKSDRICDRSTAMQLRSDFLKKKNIWEPKLKQALLNKGLNDQEADEFMYPIIKGIENDQNSVALMCGYEMINETGRGWGLILNYRHCKIRSEVFNVARRKGRL